MKEILFTEKEKDLYRRILKDGTISSLCERDDKSVYLAALGLLQKRIIRGTPTIGECLSCISLTNLGKTYIELYPDLPTPTDMKLRKLQEENLKLQNENLRYQKKLRWSIVLTIISVLAAIVFGVLSLLEY